MQTKSFSPYYRQPPGEAQVVQERKDQWIQVQLQELSYELHLVMTNFELIKERFLEITGQMPTFSDDLYEQDYEHGSPHCHKYINPIKKISGQ